MQEPNGISWNVKMESVWDEGILEYKGLTIKSFQKL